jgi:Flp pilus assembly protein TadB
MTAGIAMTGLTGGIGLLGAPAGAGIGAGMTVTVAALRPSGPAADTAATGGSGGHRGAARLRRWRAAGGDRRAGLGLAVGIGVLTATRWLAVALALGVLAGCWSRLFGGGRAERAAMARLEALAAWTESLRDLTAAGIALPEALPASTAAAAPAIRAELATLAERLAAREPLPAALLALAADLDDPGADLIVAALALNARAQGRQLRAVLSALADSVRAELADRRQVEAERRALRRGVRIVVVVTVAMALGLALGNPGYVAPYRTAVGQGVLAGVVAVFAVGFGWLAALARMPRPARFLAQATAPAAGGARAARAGAFRVGEPG